jgi:hypothetical protein
MSIPNNGNRAGNGSVSFYVLGVLCAAVGLYLISITRINLVTGQTSSPYLGLGIPLGLIGIVAIVVTQQTARRNLRK